LRWRWNDNAYRLMVHGLFDKKQILARRVIGLSGN
jgi:hypothetical protein